MLFLNSSIWPVELKIQFCHPSSEIHWGSFFLLNFCDISSSFQSLSQGCRTAGGRCDLSECCWPPRRLGCLLIDVGAPMEGWAGQWAVGSERGLGREEEFWYRSGGVERGREHLGREVTSPFQNCVTPIMLRWGREAT